MVKKHAATKEKAQAAPAPETAKPAAAQPVATVPAADEAPRGVRLRLPYPKTALELFGIDHRTWQVLIEAVWPAARTPEAVMLALAYCKARNLDPLKRPIHIVPVWSKDCPVEMREDRNKPGGYIETIWPGISEIRTTAVRTGSYAGKDGAEFGPEITEKLEAFDNRKSPPTLTESMTVTYPEWCRVTVYRMVQGVRCPFVGPKVYWKESYATKSKWSPIPNDMWAERKSGQLEKCAEAAALRAAFPEELGNEYSAEEMWGKAWHSDVPRPLSPDRALLPGQVEPRPNLNSEFKPAAAATPAAAKAEPAKKAEPEKKDTPKPEAKVDAPKGAGQGGGDPRGETPPLEGELEDHAHNADQNNGQQTQAVEEPPKPSQELLAKLDAAINKLDACTKVGQVADLREEVEQEIPPDFPELVTEWNANCDAKQKAIIDARPPKK